MTSKVVKSSCLHKKGTSGGICIWPKRHSCWPQGTIQVSCGLWLFLGSGKGVAGWLVDCAAAAHAPRLESGFIAALPATCSELPMKIKFLKLFSAKIVVANLRLCTERCFSVPGSVFLCWCVSCAKLCPLRSFYFKKSNPKRWIFQLGFLVWFVWCCVHQLVFPLLMPAWNFLPHFWWFIWRGVWQNMMFLQVLQEVSTQDEREVSVVPLCSVDIGLVPGLLSGLFRFGFVTNQKLFWWRTGGCNTRSITEELWFWGLVTLPPQFLPLSKFAYFYSLFNVCKFPF